VWAIECAGYGRRWNAAVELADRDEALTALVVAVDGLKVINDRGSHVAGDDVLVVISRCLQGLSRSTDTVARLGGDEFGVLLPGADLSVASRVEQRLSEVFQLQSLVHSGLSVSYGFAARCGTAKTAGVVLRTVWTSARDHG
jgi:diguanylate cyclase (GGDEF)-like protein